MADRLSAASMSPKLGIRSRKPPSCSFQLRRRNNSESFSDSGSQEKQSSKRSISRPLAVLQNRTLLSSPALMSVRPSREKQTVQIPEQWPCRGGRARRPVVTF
jgi:hypothetical protein